MKSITSADPPGSGQSPYRQHMMTLVKLAVGVLLLAALLYFGSIDFNALAALLDRPWAVAAAGFLVLLTIPLGALRWGILLRLLGARLPLVPLLHIQCIATVTNQFLFGPASADAVRGIYAWRALRGSAGIIAASVLADRILGLMGLIALGGLAIALRWPQLREVPQLSVLLVPLAFGLGAMIAGCAALLIAPSMIGWVTRPLARYPRIVGLLGQIQDALTAVRRRPLALLAALFISFLGHCMSVLAFVVVAMQMRTGSLTAMDYVTAAPLAFMVNAVPLTAGGLGVGEAAFDQICRWLEPAPSAAAYASIFFAYRAVSTLVLLVGFVSFVVYRTDDKDGPPGEALLRENGTRARPDV